MDASEIEKKISLGEDSVTEFKGVAKNGGKIDAHDLAKAIVAFANAYGGDIFLGVEKEGTPTGIGGPTEADALIRHVTQVCLNGIRPAIHVTLNKVLFRDCLLLIVSVPGFSPDRPYMTGENCYIRDANISRKISRNDVIRFAQSSDVHFEEEIVRGAVFDDMDPVVIERFLASLYQRTLTDPDAQDVKRHLMALKCINHGNVPTVAGLLILGRDPQQWLSDACISAVRISGTDYTTSYADRVECRGRLIEQVEGAMTFLDRHLMAPAKVRGLERVECPAPGAIPVEVLREVFFNAIVHRDYRATSQTRLFVFDDRIEIVNPGELLNRLTIDGIRIGGISQRRNPAIASILYRLGRREHLGAGIPEMIRDMTRRGLPEPGFVVGSGHFRVVLRGEHEAR